MKVRCIRLLGPDQSPLQTSKWLTIGSEYIVLTVEFDRNGQWFVRLRGDRKTEAALFSIDGFEIVSGKLAPTWVASWTPDGFFQLAPEAWLDSTFWERLHDRDPHAVLSFEIETAAIAETS